jgi:hypothetical protein
LTTAYDAESIKHQEAWKEVMRYLAATLTAEKFTTICKYFTYPLTVVNITNDILTDLYTVFDGKNAYFSVDYPQDRIKQAANIMLDELDVSDFVEDYGKKVLKNEPNSVVVVDIDKQGKPKLLYVTNERIKDYEFTKEGEFKYIAFLHTEGVEFKKYGVYDNAFYRIIREERGNFTIEVEEPHNLGYCPAHFFFDKPLINKHEFCRQVPLSNTMGVLWQWQLFEVFGYYADHYGTFPVIEYADSGCDVQGCDGGIIPAQPILDVNNQIASYSAPYECPSCNKKGLIGPGTAVGIEVNVSAEVQDTRGVLRFITPDISSLEYLDKKQAEKLNFIKINTVGYNNITTREAVNEQQIKFLMASRIKPLMDIKGEFEELTEWITETTVKLIYEVNVEAVSNFGTEFIVQSENDILLLIEQAKKAGVPSTQIAELNKMLVATKYKNDPYKVHYMNIAADLEPSPFDTREEVAAKFASGMISPEDYFIKLNFIDLIKRFERENGSLVQFGALLSYEEKIKRIKNTLFYYTKQSIIKDGNKDESIQPSGQGVSDNA